MDKNYILNYMPDYYNGVYEMEELLKAQGTALSKFDDEIEETLLNQFITKTNELGISIFEDEAGIKPTPGESLETRRNNVLLHLLPPKPLTVRYLNHLLKLMNLKAKAWVEHDKRLAIVDGESADINAEKINSIKYLMNITLPANMIYQIRVALAKAESRNNLYFGTVTTVDSDVIVKANKKQVKFRNDLITHLYYGTATVIETGTQINAANQIDFRNVVRTKLNWGVGVNEIHEGIIKANEEQFRKD